jgi:peptidoglycan/xylan/chitin deacetylase (PgdA/CDA1 family)
MKRLLACIISILIASWSLVPLSMAYADTQNLLANPSVETANGSTPANWTPNSWGANTAALTYASTGHTGNHSLAVTVSNRASGDAKWMPDAVAVTAGQTYTYSDYYSASVATELDAEYFDAGGNASYTYLTSVPAAATWTPVAVNLTVPSTAVKVSVLHILAANGSLQTDDFSLAPYAPVVPPANSDGNLILNPSFEVADSGKPVDWQAASWGANTPAFSYVSGNAHSGNYSAQVQISNYSSGDAKWYFNEVAVQPGKQYIYTDYYQASVSTSLVAQFDNGSGGYSYQTLAAVPAAVNWQQASTSFTVPAGVQTMTLFHLIAAAGSLRIDDASLLPVTVSTTPSVNITAPTSGANLSGAVTVTASATAASGITNVQFKLDGVNLGNPVTTSPYQTSWNTLGTGNGIHTLSATVLDGGGQSASAQPVQVNVQNTAATGNLMPNPSLETVNPANPKLPLDWMHGSWGTNTASFNYLSTGHTGTRSVKTQVSSYTSGSAYWYSNAVPVAPGQMYNYSDYYESNVLSEIDAAFTMSDGSTQYLYLGDPSESPASWTQFDTQFTVPAGAVSVTFFHNIYSVGWLTTDDYSLTSFSYQGFSRPIASLTFDDGYASFYDNGLPLLQKYGFKSTDFIITGSVDTDPAYMTSTQVKGLYAAGNEIGSHTVTHPDLTTLSATKQDSELKNSQVFLQNLLGVPIKDFAAPYGAMNQQIYLDGDKYYQSLRGVEAGYNAKNNFNTNNLLVQNIVSTTTVADIQGWIAEAQATNTWLILVYHQVDPSTSAGLYNTYPADLDNQLAAIKASGIAVETVSQALNELKPQL